VRPVLHVACVCHSMCVTLSAWICAVFMKLASLVRAAWRADSLNVAIFMAASPASRASRWSRAARLRPQSAVVLARSLRATRGARPKRHDAEVHRCSAAEPQSCAATLYNAPHAAIRLIRQGFGRERGHCAKAAWRAACSCWRLLLRRPRGFLHWSPRASCFRTHGSRRTDMAMALRSSTRPRPRAC